MPDQVHFRHVRVQHTMRKGPYLVSLFFLLAVTALTLLNINVADLIRVIVHTPGPLEFETQYGLYQRCTRQRPVPSLLLSATPLLSASDVPPVYLYNTTVPGDWECESFPTRSECAQFGERFCVLWSTAGYAAQLSLVPCLGALVSLLFIFLHRGERTARARARRKQWKLVSVAMFIHFLLQLTSIAIIIRVFNNDERFSRGARLDRSFSFGVASAVTSAIMVILLTFTGLAARRGKIWAAGKSSRQARRHRRTRSGRVVPVPEGTPIPPDQIVTVGEVVAATGVNEHSALLAGNEGNVAGGGSVRATDV